MPKKANHDDFLLSLVLSKVFASFASFAREAIYRKLRLGGHCEPRCGNVPLTRSLALPLSSMSPFRKFFAAFAESTQFSDQGGHRLPFAISPAWTRASRFPYAGKPFQ